MPLTWVDGAHDGLGTRGPSPCPAYARTRIIALTCERTTGFEPATLTLARWGGVLVLEPVWL